MTYEEDNAELLLERFDEVFHRPLRIGQSTWRACRLGGVPRHGELRAFARYASPPGVEWDDDTYSGDAYPVYSYGADVVEVEVDVDTYEVTTLKITTAQDIGRAIHPIMAAGQIEGGTLQAVGYGLFEELVWERGRVVNNRLTNYIIPTSLDAPEI